MPPRKAAPITVPDNSGLPPMEIAVHDPELPSLVSNAQLAILTMQTPESKIRTRQGRGGTKLKYVDHAYVTEVLNRAFGYNWDFQIVREETIIATGKPVEISVLGELTVHTGTGTIKKNQYGAQAIDYMSGSKDMPVSIGDAKKGAASDALKKCASLIGVALDLYDSDGDLGRDRQAEWNTQTYADVPMVDIRMVMNYLRKALALGFKLENGQPDFARIEAAGGILYHPGMEESLLAQLKENSE